MSTKKDFRSLPKKTVSGQVPIDVARQFRKIATDLELASNVALTQAINEFLERHKSKKISDVG